jgi:hypothetical protein
MRKNLSSALSLSKKVLFVGFVLCAIVFAFGLIFNHDKPNTNDDNGVAENRAQVYAVINDKQLNKTANGRKMVTIYRSTMCALLGEGCTGNPADGDKNFSKSLVASAANTLAYPYMNPPASGVDNTVFALQNAGFTPKTYAAQGIGYAAIYPLHDIWKLFRNVAFAFLVLVIVVIGFLIMFRFKINPQTIVSVENALPRIIATMLLITFSFAIAGFMIDLMYVLTGVALNIFAQNGYIKPENIGSLLTRAGPGRLFGEIVWNGNVWGIGSYFMGMLPASAATFVRALLGVFAGKIICDLPGPMALCAGATLPEFGLGVLLSLLLGAGVSLLVTLVLPLFLALVLAVITSVIVYIRILLLLFTAYLRIIFNVIFAPVILLPGALPGRSAFSNWIKTLAADLLAFPTTMVLIVVSSAIVKIPTQSKLWQPPFLYGGSRAGPLKVIIAIGVLFLTPDIVRSLREFIGVKGSPLKMGLGTFFGGALGIGGVALGGVGQFGSITMGLNALNNVTGGKIPGLSRLNPTKPKP